MAATDRQTYNARAQCSHASVELAQARPNNLPHTDKEVHEAFYGKYNGIFRAYVNSVYQASPRGGGAWGRG